MLVMWTESGVKFSVDFHPELPSPITSNLQVIYLWRVKYLHTVTDILLQLDAIGNFVFR